MAFQKLRIYRGTW